MSAQLEELQATAARDIDLLSVETRVIERIEAQLLTHGGAMARLRLVEDAATVVQLRVDAISDRLDELAASSASTAASMAAAVSAASAPQRSTSLWRRAVQAPPNPAEASPAARSVSFVLPPAGTPTPPATPKAPPLTLLPALDTLGGRVEELEVGLQDLRARMDAVWMAAPREGLAPALAKARTLSSSLSLATVPRHISIQLGPDSSNGLGDGFGESLTQDTQDAPAIVAGLRHQTRSRCEDGWQVAPDSEYAFRTSVWDMAMFIGDPLLDMGASAVAAWLLALHSAAQIVLIGVLARSRPALTDELTSALTSWRLDIGHSAKFFDPLTSTSLVQRVCALDGSLQLEMSDSKRGLLRSIQAYLPQGDDVAAAISSGPALCLVALVLWTATFFREVHAIWSLVQGLRSVPGGHRTRLQQVDGHTYLASIGRSRNAYIGLLLTARLALAAVLFGCGIHFLLSQAIRPMDMLLHVVALKVVFGLDKVLFEALAPGRVRNLLRKLEPLPPRPSKWGCRGLDLQSAFLVLAMLLVVLIAGFASVLPILGRLHSARDALCGGNQAFIYATDALGLTYASPTNPPLGVQQDGAARSTHTAVVLEQIHPETMPLLPNASGRPATRVPLALALPGQGPDAVAARLDLDVAGASAGLQALAGGNASCSDVFQVAPLQFARALSAVAPELAGVRSCADLRAHCGDGDGGHISTYGFAAVRALCPETCACGDPSADLFDADASRGCPAACGSGPAALAALGRANCTQGGAEELRGSSRWRRWAAQLGHRAAAVGGSMGDGTVALLCTAGGGDCEATMLSLGCGVVGYWSAKTKEVLGAAQDVCSGEWLPGALRMRPLATACPLACGCAERPPAPALPSPFCPAACGQ